MSREKCLLIGEPNTAKTVSIIALAVLYPERQVSVFDPDDGISKLMEEELKLKVKPVVKRENYLDIVAYEGLPNLQVHKVTPDWKALLNSFELEDKRLKEQDWMCFDMLGRFWSLAEEYFSLFIYGEDPTDHLLAFRKQVGRTDFGGFDGSKDWSVIKRLHNAKILDKAVVYSCYNVMATTGLKEIIQRSKNEKAPDSGIESVYHRDFGFLPEGEKHNIHRFSTQAYLFRKPNEKYFFRLIRDKGRKVDTGRAYEITSRSFWEVYREIRNSEGYHVV